MDVVQVVSEVGEPVRVLVLDDGSLMAQFKESMAPFEPLSDLIKSDILSLVDWATALHAAAKTETYKVAERLANEQLIAELE